MSLVVHCVTRELIPAPLGCRRVLLPCAVVLECCGPCGGNAERVSAHHPPSAQCRERLSPLIPALPRLVSPIPGPDLYSPGNLAVEHGVSDEPPEPSYIPGHWPWLEFSSGTQRRNREVIWDLELVRQMCWPAASFHTTGPIPIVPLPLYFPVLDHLSCTFITPVPLNIL